MRGIVATLDGMVALAAVSVQAAPLAPANASAAELRTGLPIEAVRQGCGHGWHRTRWREQWGYWHWGHCVPNRGPYNCWGAGWDYPFADWRDPSGGWGNSIADQARCDFWQS